MTTGPEELSLNYLLDPAFQLVNTAGRPLTNGWIEVYYHGTRDKYYCASDFDGTLHPFRIPLDSLGSNIVLADPNFSYDIYVYNSFGSLQMSRYNVNPGSGSGGGSSSEGGPAEHWSSDTAGGASTTVTGGTTVYLTLPSSEDQPEFVDHTTDTAIFLKEGLYHIDAVISFKQDEDDLQNIIKDLVVNTGLIGWDAQMTGQKNWTGPESTDDDRHFLELHTVVSVPEDSLQTLYFQITSPVDLDSAAIEKLDIVKLEAGGNGIKYAAGYGIDITGQVISTSGMMPEASAANFVDNSTYQVDIQNIYETIAETSAMIPSGVATEGYVQDYTSAFITEDALNGYATQEWVEDQGYITSADLPQSVPLVAGEGISIVDTSASTIISIDSAYGAATHEWVEDYVSDATSAFITSADIPDVPEDLVTSAELASVSGDIVSQIPSLDGYATEQFVEDYTSAYITSGDVPVYTAGDHIDITDNEISVDGVSGVLAGEGISITASGGNYYINNLGLVPDDVVTSGDLATVSGQLSRVSTYSSAGWLPLEINYKSLRFNYGNTGTPSSSGVRRIVEVSNDGSTYTTLGELVPVPSTSGLVLTSLTSSGMTWAEAPDSGLDQVYHDASLTGDGTSESPLSVTSADIWNAAAGMNEYPISAGPGMSIEDVDGVTVFSCTGGDVPEDVVTSGQLATVSGEIMNEIPDLTGYATQTWVSDGFMETSGLEFNSQDEISGYNGHPVMTVDSEKQWLTHDDTIAHVTNSAQYAFGVNVPVVAQAMGTDETLLYTNGANVSACTLSEDIKNFNRFKIGVRTNSGEELFEFTTGPDGTSYDIVTSKGNNQGVISICQFTTSGTKIEAVRSQGMVFTWGGTSPTYRSNQDMHFIQNVYGVGRKENT